MGCVVQLNNVHPSTAPATADLGPKARRMWQHVFANVAAESNVVINSMPLTSGGDVVQVWLEGEASAELQAIAMTARHRLERGIWTSPGAGAP